MSVIWQPGMRCVCVIELEPVAGLHGAQIALKGSVYTVRRVGLCEVDGFVVLWLSEISNAHLVGQVAIRPGLNIHVSGEPGFDARHFRPLAETRLDQFRAHLAPTPREKVDA